MVSDTEGQQISHVIVDGVSPAAGGMSKLRSPVLGRPVLAYVLDVVGAVSDSVTVLVDAAEQSSVREGFDDRNVKWIPVETSTTDGGDGVFDVLSSGSFLDEDGAVLLVSGHLPLLSVQTLKAFEQFHERGDADVSLLAGVGEQEDAMVCRVQTQTGGTDCSPDGTSAEAEDPPRGDVAGPVLICNAARLREAASRSGGASDAAMIELIRSIAESGAGVRLFNGHDRRDLLQVASSERRAEAIRTLRKRVLDRLLDRGVDVLAPDLTYVEPEVEIGAGTVIEPFVVIRNGVEIGSDCHVGPFCQLRRGTILEDDVEIGNYVETKKTQVGQGSKAKHLSYLGDATLGSDVNIGAGTITANYDGTNKHRTVIGDGCSTGSNTVLVAPVRMEKNSKTGAGAVVLQEDHVQEGEVVVGVPARSLSDES